MKALLKLLAAGISLLLVASSTFAQTPAACTITFFTSPTAGDVLFPQGINRFGNIVGFHQNPAHPEIGSRAFVRFSNGTFGSCCKIAGLNTDTILVASKRNASGVVVGRYEDNNLSTFHGFVSSGSQTVTFDYPGAELTNLFGINSFGSLVGIRVPKPPRTLPFIGFVWKNGSFHDVQFGTTATNPTSINDSGVIVGWHQVGTSTHGFVLSGGAFHDVLVPGSSTTLVNDINNAGVMVGTFDTGHGVQSFILKNGAFQDVVVPGARDVEVFGINGFNVLTGFANFPNSSGTVTTKAFLGRCSL